MMLLAGFCGRFGSVPIFHRTLSQWFDLLSAAGLVVEKLGEPTVGTAPHALHPVIEDTRVTPMSLHVRARRVGA